jgi:hypothetical protein
VRCRSCAVSRRRRRSPRGPGRSGRRRRSTSPGVSSRPTPQSPGCRSGGRSGRRRRRLDRTQPPVHHRAVGLADQLLAAAVAAEPQVTVHGGGVVEVLVEHPIGSARREWNGDGGGQRATSSTEVHPQAPYAGGACSACAGRPRLHAHLGSEDDHDRKAEASLSRRIEDPSRCRVREHDEGEAREEGVRSAQLPDHG